MLAHRILAVLALMSAAGIEASGQEWTRFRGPNGAGVSAAKTVPVSWAAGDFNWRIELAGVGHASPVAWGDRLYIVSGDEQTGARILASIDADTGRTTWTKTFESKSHRKHQLNSFASSTPTVDANHVYVTWATPDAYKVVAVDHAGVLVWQTDVGPYKTGHGFGVSPIVFGDTLIVPNEQEGQSSLIALDRMTGQERWKVERNTQIAYSTPCVYAPNGRSPELIFSNWKHGITAIDPKSGRTNWEIAVFDEKHTETSIGSPIVHGDLVLGTCGWLGYATHTVAVRPDAKVAGKGREIYRVDRGAPLTTTPLVVNGLLFLWADNGIVTCVDALTGKEHWKQRIGGNFYASPVAVGEAVYCASTKGEMIVLAAAAAFKRLATNPILEASHSSPAVIRGTMFIRTFSHLISVGGPAS
ncbi:MAG: PQQ-binding-like beta-propeller repeat protein [Planctomycetota bacterium]|nr:PQQ-binding-like beta-propeller repeat protein [Planctomycetota bacterium]